MNGLERIIAGLGRLAGWRSWLLSFGLGVLSTFSLPPLHLWPVLFVTFMGLLWMLMGERSRKSRFAIGWWFGFGFFAAGLYWISFALLVFSDRLWWMVPFAALGLPAFLAVYTGLAGLCTALFRDGWKKVAAFIFLWVLFEWLRGTLFTGFPWNLIGYAWGGSDAFSQMASLTGAYGLSLLVMATVSLPALLPVMRGRARLAVLAILLLVPLSSWMFGAQRLADVQAVADTSAGGPGMRIVQPAIPQREKWGARYRSRNFRTFLEMSVRGRPDWVKTVIWPETAATFFLENSEPDRQVIAGLLPEGGHLITGAPRKGQEDGALFNSVLAIGSDGRVAASYDKSHLVPFGEYVPLRTVLPIAKVTHGTTDYTPGPGPRTLFLQGLPPVSPLVCYEAVFPGNVTNSTQAPGWILNLTNDAWYGRTFGPYQHKAIVRMRAIEEGLPVVRAASTGVSAVFDPYGREIGSLGLESPGVLDFRLPPKLEEATFFSRSGNGLVVFLVFLGLGILIASDNRSKTNHL